MQLASTIEYRLLKTRCFYPHLKRTKHSKVYVSGPPIQFKEVVKALSKNQLHENNNFIDYFIEALSRS